MKKIVLIFCCLTLFEVPQAHADWFGADLAYLAQIVQNTLGTLTQLQHETGYLSDAYAGINDKIERLQTIAHLALTPTMSQVFRLYPTKAFYDLANTENIATEGRK